MVIQLSHIIRDVYVCKNTFLLKKITIHQWNLHNNFIDQKSFHELKKNNKQHLIGVSIEILLLYQ